MSDVLASEGTDFAAQPAANDGVSAGTLLRRAREGAGLHVAALAVSLKVPVRKLEALEEDRWDVLPDAVFVRALASSVCRTLKIDPQPVLERLPQTAAPRLVRDGEGINTPFRAPSDGAPPSWLDHVTKPVFLAVFALLLGALVLILLPTAQTDDAVGPSATATAVPAQGAPAAAPAVTEVTTPSAAAPAPASAPAPATAPVPVSAAAASPVLAAPAAAASVAPTPVAAVTEVAASASAAGGIVSFSTKGPSWIEVTDAKGVVTMRRLLSAGESAGASGALPLQVTIGRADQTEVQVRGKPYDLKPVSRDNVARFEVK